MISNVDNVFCCNEDGNALQLILLDSDSHKL